MKLKFIIKLLIGWRLFLLASALLGLYLLPFKDSFPYRADFLMPFGHPLWYSWANFDGVHYLGIAKNGYWAQFTQAFFPIYPYLVKAIDIVFNNLLFSGLLISHVSLVVLLHYLYKLIRLDHPKAISLQSVLFVMSFPTSYYLGSLYTESFFAALCVGCLYCYRTNRKPLAILLAALASGTRVIGIFLLPALIYEEWLSLPANKRKSVLNIPYQRFITILFSSGGLLTYMYYLHVRFDNALYFLSAQPVFGASRSVDKLILLYQVVFRYLKMLTSVNPLSIVYYTVTQEFVLSMLFLVLLVIGFKYIRRSYLIFALGAYLIPTLTGTFSSMPRYVLILFPAFVVLSIITAKHPKIQKSILIVFVVLLAINTILFTRGYWIA